MKKVLFAIMLILPLYTWALIPLFGSKGDIGEILPFVVDFQPSQSTVSTVGAASIKDVATFLNNHPTIKIVVVGFTRNSANASASVKLSQTRAEAVKSILVNRHKIDENRLLTIGAGIDVGLASHLAKTSDAVMFYEHGNTLSSLHSQKLREEREAEGMKMAGALASILLGFGTGETSCSYCNGSGYVMGEVCPKCGGSQTMYDENKAIKEQKQLAESLIDNTKSNTQKTGNAVKGRQYITNRFGDNYFEGYISNKMVNGRGMTLIVDANNSKVGRESYSGEWSNNRYHGKGVLRLSDGNRIIGVFKNGEFTGDGVILTRNKDIYVGSIVNFKMSGKGIMYSSFGDVYEGEWENNDLDGVAKVKYADGRKYSGQYKKGGRSGYGVMDYPDGGRYEGDFFKGKREGKGKLKWGKGNLYTGQFNNNRFHGTGVMNYENGDCYEGDFSKGEMSGFGVYKWSNGDFYVGEFLSDKCSGDGTKYYSKDHVFKKGKWKSGELTKLLKEGTYVDSDLAECVKEEKYANGESYSGHFRNGCYEGEGTYIYADGGKYVGMWRYGKIHGKGKFYYSDGAIYNGDFEKGVRSGKGTYTSADGMRYVGEFKNNVRDGYGVTYYKNHTYKEGYYEKNTLKKLKAKGEWAGLYKITRTIYE